MNNAPNIRIEVTEGAQIPDPRDRRLLNAWTLAFCVAVVALVTVCSFYVIAGILFYRVAGHLPRELAHMKERP